MQYNLIFWALSCMHPLPSSLKSLQQQKETVAMADSDWTWHTFEVAPQELFQYFITERDIEPMAKKFLTKMIF